MNELMITFAFELPTVLIDLQPANIYLMSFRALVAPESELMSLRFTAPFTAVPPIA